MRVQGHTLDELDDLRDQFSELITQCVQRVAAKVSIALTASIDTSALNSVTSSWDYEVSDVLLPQVVAVYEGGALATGHQIAQGFGQGIPAVSNDYAVTYLQQAKNRLSGVSSELWTNIQNELVTGLQLGESQDEIATRIHAAGELTLGRAKTIARTEINGASNAGSEDQIHTAQLTGKKEWLATEDGRTRHDHAIADGQKVAINGAFTVGGYTLKYPGDPLGPASEVVNCRCTQIYEIDDDVAPAECDCDKMAIVSAGSIVSGGCICPIMGHETNHETAAQQISMLSASQQKYVYDLFQHPKSISPAYGGGKIHKQLAAVHAELDKSLSPYLKDLNDTAILKIVDNHYGKNSFLEKYEEWLVGSAGKKATGNKLIAKLAGDIEKSTDSIIKDEIKPIAEVLDVKPVAPIVEIKPTSIPTGHVPIVQQAGDITVIPAADKAAFYADFKKNKVTAIWSNVKIWDSVEKTLAKGYSFTEHEALKILDEQAALNKASTGFFEKMLKWESTPAGQKVMGAPALVTKVEAKVATNVEAKVAEHITTAGEHTASKYEDFQATENVVVQSVNIEHTPLEVRTSVLLKWNNFGPLLTKPDKTVYAKLQELKAAVNKQHGTKYSDLDLLRILDEQKSNQLGVKNQHLFEQKIVGFLKTPAGKKLAESYETGVPAVIKVTTKKIAEKTSAGSIKTVTTNMAETNEVLAEQVSGMRAAMSTTDDVFPDISVVAAQKMQSEIAATEPWTAAQRASLRYYTGEHYTAMNGYLRGRQYYDKADAKTIQHILNAQAGMRPSTRPLTVYRGTNVQQFGVTHVDQSMVGKTFEDKGFMSTSAGRPTYGGGVRLMIECPTGTPMAFVKSISKYDHEDEMLLAAGTKYKVISVKTEDSYHTVVTVRVIP